jgi:hypothetical protein
MLVQASGPEFERSRERVGVGASDLQKGQLGRDVKASALLAIGWGRNKRVNI